MFMGLHASIMVAARSLTRRKTKNLSAILAITLGVTLLVGIQITTDTLENSFMTSLLQGEGEVDFTISNSTTSGYLKADDQDVIQSLVPHAVGIMPELTMNAPVLSGSQFDASVKFAGIPLAYPDAFGTFYDWKTGSAFDLNSLLVSNTSVLVSSTMAEKFGLNEDISIPFNLTTEFTNLTATVAAPPTVPLTNWIVDSNSTSAQYILNNSSTLSLEVLPVNFTGSVTMYTANCPRLSLSNYDYINVTATGSNNTVVMLGFSLDDGNVLYAANLTTLESLNAAQLDLTPYSERTLRGDAFLAVMSANGLPADIEISEIKFESSMPIITYTPVIERVDLQAVGIFDSNRPGIGSQYSGVVFNLEHLQQWMSLHDPQQETDIVKTYLVALQTDHFVSEINEDYLQEQVNLADEAIPTTVDLLTGNTQKMYTVSSARLTFFSISEMIMTLLSTILTALGLLITITGILLITNVQLMNVEDREFQTGVLRAVGQNRLGIAQSMLIENLFQGVIGGLLGLVGGLGFGQIVAAYLVSLFGTGTASVQPVISQQVVILSVIIGVALGILTGVLPTLRASRVNIVEALRGIKVSFKEKSTRNLALLGIVLVAAGALILLVNGVFDKNAQVIWVAEGWDTLYEWRNILIGAGFLFSGIGMVLSKFISYNKAINFTAATLWIAPALLFIVAMGEWVTDITGLATDLLMIGIMEIMVSSILFVSVNLNPVMKGLRRFLVKIRGAKGVGQIAPAMISSHKTRSTLTFAIFAVILTLNVTVATLVPTNLGTVIETEQDSRGIDIIVNLNKPEARLTGTSYVQELYKLDSEITDVIGFKTYRSLTDYQRYVALTNPYSSDFNAQTDMLPFGYGELTREQIRGNETDDEWRYDFYLSSFPDGTTYPDVSSTDVTDAQLSELTKEAWEMFFDPSYTMAAYNVSLSKLMSADRELSDLDLSSFGGYVGNELEDVAVLHDENGEVIKNPVVFTDSFLLPIGMQIWIPMNTSELGLPVYQAFTVAGRLDLGRAGGFPLSSLNLFSGDDFTFMEMIGNIYLPEHWANQTSFLAEADGETSISRAPTQYNQFLIKTTYAMDDPALESIARAIQDFTNTNDNGYRSLAGDNFYIADTTVLYSKVSQSLEMVERVVSFLQIYVTFGLVIGTIGMTVIAVRNVSERKREIGMMRAIGFPRNQVMLSVLLELVVLGIIGLIIGVANGLLISVGFANMQGTVLIIPWGDIAVYLGFITLMALIAGAIPGWVASKIPPAEALRYVG